MAGVGFNVSTSGYHTSSNNGKTNVSSFDHHRKVNKGEAGHYAGAGAHIASVGLTEAQKRISLFC